MAKSTKGRFGFHQGGDEHEPPTAVYTQIYVKSSALSRAPDLAISGHLTTDAEIDEFVYDALAELEEIRVAQRRRFASAALGQAFRLKFTAVKVLPRGRAVHIVRPLPKLSPRKRAEIRRRSWSGRRGSQP